MTCTKVVQSHLDPLDHQFWKTAQIQVYLGPSWPRLDFLCKSQLTASREVRGCSTGFKPLVSHLWLAPKTGTTWNNQCPESVMIFCKVVGWIVWHVPEGLACEGFSRRVSQTSLKIAAAKRKEFDGLQRTLPENPTAAGVLTPSSADRGWDSIENRKLRLCRFIGKALRVVSMFFKLATDGFGNVLSVRSFACFPTSTNRSFQNNSTD